MGEMVLWFLYLITLIAKGSAVAITGVQEGVNTDTGERPFRQEFSIFKDSGAAFDLYIQALYYFTQEDQDNEQSYFSIAGIHGYPFISWDGVEGDFQAGYCTHESVLFPTWHRPYLALFEQALWKQAQDVATQYPDDKRDEYVAAAKTLRIPYWDWALDVRIPDIVNSPTVQISLPDGPCNCPNPLYEYRFHPLPPDPLFPEGSDLNLFDRTVRSPDDNGESQPENSNRRLEANGNALKTLTYQLIASQTEYGPFSNTAYSDERSGRYNNIENIHNAIHTFIGNGGHMSNIPYSSFDPIFWLHHANVDRLFAIWQAVHPTSYTISQANAVGTFTEAPGLVETVNSPLTPFHSDNAGSFYTSATARSTRSFGYSYPDIVDWGVTTAQLSSDVRAKFNALYNPTGSIRARSTSSDGGNVTTVTSNGAGHQWMVNIRVDKSALPTSFYIHFFLGEVPEATETWGYAPNLIASHAVLLPRSTSSSKEFISYGQIPLTTALLRSPSVPDLKPESVVPVLTKQLNWRIQTLKNEPVPTEKVTSLKLYVAGQEVYQWDVQTKDKLPLYGKLIPYRGITKGKAGALGDDDPL